MEIELKLPDGANGRDDVQISYLRADAEKLINATTASDTTWSGQKKLKTGRWKIQYRSGNEVCNTEDLTEVRCMEGFEDKGGQCQAIPTPSGKNSKPHIILGVCIGITLAVWSCACFESAVWASLCQNFRTHLPFAACTSLAYMQTNVCVQVCILLLGYNIKKRPDRAKELLASMLKTECKLAMKLLFEGWDFFSDTWILVHDVLSNDLVSDLLVPWLVCRSFPALHVSWQDFERLHFPGMLLHSHCRHSDQFLAPSQDVRRAASPSPNGRRARGGQLSEEACRSAE